MPEITYWNGEPCRASKVTVRVGKALKPTYWFAGLEGQKRNAVEICYSGDCFYIDDADGSGWNKVTNGKGSPGLGHRSLEIDESYGVYERG